MVILRGIPEPICARDKSDTDWLVLCGEAALVGHSFIICIAQSPQLLHATLQEMYDGEDTLAAEAW